MKRIYLDNNATTSVDPRVAEAFQKELTSPPSNPSSQHFFGQKAKTRLLNARRDIAAYCKAKDHEILFTASGTEAMNLLIRGLAPKGKRILSSNIEHAAVENTLLALQKEGHTLSLLPATKTGAPSLSTIEQEIPKDVGLLVFSAVNSETGAKIDLEGLSALALKWNIPLIIDGIALLGKEPLTIPKGVTAMGFSPHKCHGPKGIGFAFVRSGKELLPQITGGGQEFGLRSGTENLPAIIATAALVKILKEETEENEKQMAMLRDLFEETILKEHSDIIINGKAKRICNVSNLSFVGVDAETLFMQLDLQGVSASQGSACSSGALEPSRVLKNMGLSKELVSSALRFSLSKYTTKEEVLSAASTVISLISMLK